MIAQHGEADDEQDVRKLAILRSVLARVAPRDGDDDRLRAAKLAGGLFGVASVATFLSAPLGPR